MRDSLIGCEPPRSVGGIATTDAALRSHVGTFSGHRHAKLRSELGNRCSIHLRYGGSLLYRNNLHRPANIASYHF